MIYTFLKKKIFLSSKIIWNVCTPRCASTFFTKNLEEICREDRRYNYISKYFYGIDHQQIIDWNTAKKKIKFNKINIFERSHVTFDKNFESYIGDKHVTNVFTRNIFDTILSLKEYMDKKYTRHGIVNMPWANNHNIIWNKLHSEEKFEKIIFFYLPWHIQFLDRWLYAKRKKKYLYTHTMI